MHWCLGEIFEKETQVFSAQFETLPKNLLRDEWSYQQFVKPKWSKYIRLPISFSKSEEREKKPLKSSFFLSNYLWLLDDMQRCVYSFHPPCSTKFLCPLSPEQICRDCRKGILTVFCLGEWEGLHQVLGCTQLHGCLSLCPRRNKIYNLKMNLHHETFEKLTDISPLQTLNKICASYCNFIRVEKIRSSKLITKVCHIHDRLLLFLTCKTTQQM